MRELQYDTKYNLGSECLAEYKYKKSSISSDLEVKLKADDALVWGLNWLLHPQIGIFLYKNLYFYHLVEGIFAIKYKYKQKFKNRCLRLKYSYIKIKKEKKRKKEEKKKKKRTRCSRLEVEVTTAPSDWVPPPPPLSIPLWRFLSIDDKM